VRWTIAPIAVDDADEVGRVHVRVWQEAYAGLMPADHLAGLDPVGFAARWREALRRPTPGTGHWLARDDVGVVGITSSGPARDDDAPTALELYAINLLERAQGSGVADDLLTHAIGDAAAYLWVLEGNQRARAFYRRHGFADDGGRKQEPDTGAVEVRMSRDVVVR
jgi:ribosomal protein S18 acetylase RimI-like enzyme